MIKLSIRQKFKYSNVIIEKYQRIESPWVPRISENINSMGLNGKIKQIHNNYINEPKILLDLDDIEENIVFDSSQVTQTFFECHLVYAYKDGAAAWDRTIVYQEPETYEVLGEHREMGTEFNADKFDEQFVPKEKSGFWK